MLVDSKAMQDQQRELFLSSRDRHPPNEAAAFVENRVALPGQPYPVFSERSAGFVPVEDAKRQQEESAALWKRVDEEKEALFDLMQQVQERLQREQGDDASIQPVNLRQCTWAQVISEVQRTGLKWKNRPSKQGKTMVFIDKVARHSTALESWLGLLPMGDYGSSICGVFQLAIGAAGQYGKVEEAVFEALSEIPRILESARRYVEMYCQMRDHFLEQRTFELFRAILNLLRHIMQFFADGKSHKVFGTILKQGAYKDELLNGVEDIKARAQAVNDEALQCQGRMISKVHDKVHENSESLQVFFQKMMQLFLSSPRFQSRDPGYPDLSQDVSRLMVTGYDQANADYMAPSDDEERRLQEVSRRSPDPLAQQVANMAKSQEESIVARERILSYIDYDPTVVPAVINSALQLDPHDAKAKARAIAMIHHPKIGAFMDNKQSSAGLLVNGRDDLSSANGISPISFVAAGWALTWAVKEDPSRFAVKYFCASDKLLPAKHPATDHASTPISMIASLVGQLLIQLRDKGTYADLSFLDDRGWSRVAKLKPKTLCRVFCNLVQQMPAGSILLCLIDEISLFEAQRHQKSTNLVMDTLVKLANGEKGKPQVFKLLVTCQDRALGVSSYFLNRTVDLEENPEPDDSDDYWISKMKG